MEKFNLLYSKKNIPIPSKHAFLQMLVAKTENLIRRMRWKVLEFDGKLSSTEKRTFGFRTTNYPPPQPDLEKFEDDLMDLIRGIETRPHSNDLQSKMREDIRNIKNCGKVIVSADKSTNLYKMAKTDYSTCLSNNITSTYKKTDIDHIESIDKGALKCAEELGLADRIRRVQTSESYVTVKDHKEDFNAKPSFRLINPAKSDIGRVSKQLLDEINQELLTCIGVNQWKNTHSVIDWFKNIENKNQCTFIQFDIENFYPSISETLFNKAIDFAKLHVQIPDAHLKIIRQSRRTLLFHDGEPWIKTSNDNDFDVPMGSFDGAEICELVGTFMLSEITKVVTKEDIGLYRDDGLGLMRNIGKPEVERRKKQIIKIFKNHGLKIIIHANLISVKYLDVEFDLRNNIFRPYRKPNSEPLYISKQSNHPPSILKQMPSSISRRLTDISSSEEVFLQASPLYEAALRVSGYEESVEYKQERGEGRRNRKRKVIWFNPPFSANIKTNIGRKFLNLVRKHFHPLHRLNKIFNTRTIKVSYCCMRNMSSIISGHNRYVLQEETDVGQQRRCNCPKKTECPLSGKCLDSNIVYEGEVINHTDNLIRPYVGLTSSQWKERLAVHNQGIRHREYSKGCELTKYVWELKDNNKQFSIRWKILEHVKGQLVGGECKLCVAEKLHIITHPARDQLLNSNCFMKCLHKNKQMLASINAPRRGRPRRKDPRETIT